MNVRNKEKLLGMKQRIREQQERNSRLTITLAAAILTAVIAISSLAIYSWQNPSQTITAGQLRAAIVDQEGLSQSGGPNSYLIENATNALEQDNYTVDYYRGEKVTVDFYRNLPALGYSLIVLRVHSAPLVKDGNEVPIVSLFSSEPYSKSKYVLEQLNDEVVTARYYEGSPEYFAITPGFVRNCMRGSFNNATVIMMGCDGLKYKSTAEAFIDKGARVYISWTGPVLADHTDSAAMNLLQHLLSDGKTIKESVRQANVEVGPDPVYYSRLEYFPLDAGDQRLPSNGD